MAGGYFVEADWVNAVIALICGTGRPGAGTAELRIAVTIWSAVQSG